MLATYDLEGNFIGCGPGFRTAAGATYLLQVALTYSPGPFSLEVRPFTPIAASLSVDQQAKIDRFGRVTVSGTLRCTGDFAVAFSVDVYLHQTFAKAPAAEGWGFNYGGQPICDGRANPWTAVVGSHTSSAFWTGSMSATPYARVLTNPSVSDVTVGGLTSKVSAQRQK